ncbi:MAG: hypothetical protein NUW23_11225, partial [Firmicutes bacterium]|nr:hypothetical protein [Bacillota bacterium]
MKQINEVQGGLCSPYIPRVIDAILRGRQHTVALVAASPRFASRAREQVAAELGDGAAFEIPIYGFDSFVMHILNRVGRRRRTVGDLERELIVGQLLREARAQHELLAFGPSADKPGFARAIGEVIDEVKLAAGRAADLRRALLPTGERSDAGIRPALHDLLLLFERYEGALAGRGLSDREDAYLELAEFLEAAPPGAVGALQSVWFEHFFDPTPAQARVVRAVATHVGECEVNLPYDDDRPELAEVLGRARELYGTVPVVSKPAGRGCRTPDPTLAALSRGLFTHSPGPPAPCGSVRLITASGPSREGAEVAREIKRLIVSEGRRPEDICVVVASPNGFMPGFLASMEEFGVASSAAQLSPLFRSPLISDCLALADALACEHSGFDLPALCSSPYIGAGPGLGSEIVASLKVRGMRLSAARWRQVLGEYPELEAGRAFLAKLTEAWSGLGRGRAISEHCADLRVLLSRMGTPACVFEPENREYAVEAWAAWAGFTSLLREIEQMSGIADMTWAEFADFLRTAAGRRSFCHRPGSCGGVSVMGPSALRGLSYPVVFLCALTEGGFPRDRKRTWAFREPEVSRLWESGIRLATASEFAASERFMFHVAISSASDLLYLTYPSSRDDGSFIRRSFFVDEAVHALGWGREEEARSTRAVSPAEIFPADPSALASERELGLWVMATAGVGESAIARQWGADHPEEWRRALGRAARDARAAQNEFTEYDGEVTDAEAIKWLGERFGPGSVWSAGALDLYSQCPFK